MLAPRNELQALRDRVEELEALIGLRLPAPMELRRQEAEVAGILLKANGRCVSKEFIYRAIYGHRAESDQPELKSVDVLICTLRKKLKPRGIEIRTKWATGHYLDPDSRTRLSAFLNASD